ncbi:MAG: tetratricopeptide repeat protein [Myxococcales bacterium]|nr:tetratricopeptide repeat protein [Myxococcales bacterium]
MPDKAPAGRLIGRDGDLAALAEASRASRLVSVVGAPGVGKSALVHEWLAGTGAGDRRAVVVPLEGATTAEELAGKVAGALGVPLPSGGLDRFAPILAADPLLLVLDGLEVPAEAVCASVPAWLDRAPDLLVLGTRGAPLGAPGERVVRVSPLAQADAVSLFERRAADAGWRPRNTPEEARALETLAARLDGLPLAIELAAARASVLTPKQMIERLDRDMGILEGLRAAFALTWSLLEPSSRALLAAASVFVGPFTVDAIEAVLPDMPASELVAALDDVARRSLVSRLDLPDEQVGFRLLSTVRSFARRELDVAGQTDLTLDRADEYLVRAAERLAGLLVTEQESTAAARLEEMAGDLGRAVERAAALRPAMAARGAIALATFASPRGSAPVALLSRALVAAKRTADRELVARLEYELARARTRLGFIDEARAMLDDALRRLDGGEPDAGLVARLLIERGKQRLQRGDFSGSRADLDGAVRALEEVEDPYADGLAANERGRLEEAMGELGAAAASFLRARARFRHAGSVRMQGIALQNLGVVRYAEGRLEEARALLEEALELHRLAHDPASAADNLLNTGSVLLTAGKLDEAEAATVRALDEERRLGNRRFEGLALGNLAILAHEREDQQVAYGRYQRALTVFRETGDARFAAIFTPFLAACEASLGLWREATTDFAEAREAFTAFGDPGNLAVLDTLLGVLSLNPAPGEPPRLDDAEARLERAEAALASRDDASRTPELAIAVRLLRAAQARRGGAAAPARPAPASSSGGEAVLAIGPDVRWFVVRGARVELGARAAPRRILAVLVEQRLRAPGVGLPQEAVFAAGWPGQKADFEAARARVYTAIRTLRRLGLEDVLLRQDDGYLLDPRLRLDVSSTT